MNLLITKSICTVTWGDFMFDLTNWFYILVIVVIIAIIIFFIGLYLDNISAQLSAFFLLFCVGITAWFIHSQNEKMGETYEEYNLMIEQVTNEQKTDSAKRMKLISNEFKIEPDEFSLFYKDNGVYIAVTPKGSYSIEFDANFNKITNQIVINNGSQGD